MEMQSQGHESGRAPPSREAPKTPRSDPHMEPVSAGELRTWAAAAAQVVLPPDRVLNPGGYEVQTLMAVIDSACNYVSRAAATIEARDRQVARLRGALGGIFGVSAMLDQELEKVEDLLDEDV